MSKISKSPERHSFQKTGYVERLAETGEEPSQEYLDMFDNILKQHQEKFSDPKSRENSMEYDLLTTDWVLEKARASETYSQNLYAAMCNNEFQKLDVMPILKNETWGCSWRYAGGIIADMRQQGDYIDWYCSGIRGGVDFSGENEVYDEKKLVPEGLVTDEIRNDLQRLGWVLVPGGDWEDFIK
jgi:hypothetical protein